MQNSVVSEWFETVLYAGNCLNDIVLVSDCVSGTYLGATNGLALAHCKIIQAPFGLVRITLFLFQIWVTLALEFFLARLGDRYGRVKNHPRQ